MCPFRGGWVGGEDHGISVVVEFRVGTYGLRDFGDVAVGFFWRFYDMVVEAEWG